MSVKLYIEGGGEGQLLDRLFRKGWRQFFERAGLAERMPGVVRGKGRTQTFDLFTTAVQAARAGVLPMLVVDSEDPVEKGHSVWQHLKARDDWNRPTGATDEQAFLMVQIMETWFLADRNLLGDYFGASFRPNQIPAWLALEEVTKAMVLDALDRATAACGKPYTKGKVSYELLGRLNPNLVEAACPHAKSLLDRLRAP